jgi:hypothetical protein
VSLRYGESDGSDDDVLLLELGVYNPTEEPIRFLPWHTPLDGYRNDFMHVLNRVGDAASYRGEMVKRRGPQVSEYRTILPGERVTVELQRQSPVVPAGAPIQVEFAVRNVGTEAVAFLPWYTPLETIPTRYFEPRPLYRFGTCMHPLRYLVLHPKRTFSSRRRR